MKAAARYCALCGKPLNGARGKCDTCEPAPGGLVPHGKDYSTVIGVGILALMLAFGFGTAMKWDFRTGTGASQSASGSVPREQWESVAKVTQSVSPNAIVEPYDPSAPNTMRIIVSGSIARDMGSYDARKLATMARSRMGEQAIVYVKDDTGKTLAKAAPWGVE